MVLKLTKSEKKHLLAVVSADFDYLKDLSNALGDKFVMNSMSPEEMKREALDFIEGKRATISEQTRIFMSTILPRDAEWQKRVSKKTFGFKVGDFLTTLRIHSGRAGANILVNFAEELKKGGKR